MAEDHQAVIAEIVEKRTRGSLPLHEWGPKCHGCGGDEFRIDGYCSIECRDYHDDEDVATLAAALASLRKQLQDAQQALEEVHEYQCGCARPGAMGYCVAQPVVVFAALAAAGTETRA